MTPNAHSATNMRTEQCVLGIDVGGTQTRWALATLSGDVISRGVVEGFSGARMHLEAGRIEIQTRLLAISALVKSSAQAVTLCGLHVGVTGIGDGTAQLTAMMCIAFALPANHVVVTSDVELTYHGALASGEGYLIYAGTGSIAAFISATGELHRAGGRGVILDDAGGGYWIAREALRRIWRREDEQPGAWRTSPMAHALFAQVGGDSSIFSARYLMENDRGVVGKLALSVAAHASEDSLAAEILSDAGIELARLARAMRLRYGERKIVVAGRASQLHPLIESGMRRAMPANTLIEFRQVDGHIAAAKMAAKEFMANEL